MKIKYSDNLQYLVNVIESCDHKMTIVEMFNEAVNNKLYYDFYINFNILNAMRLEHNENVK